MIKLGYGKVVKIEKIRCDYDFRSRDKETYEQLKYSLLRFGNLTPIAISPSFLLLDGYARVSIFKELGVKEVNASLVQLTIDQTKRFSLVQSQITSGAKFDSNKVNEFVQKNKLIEDLQRIGFQALSDQLIEDNKLIEDNTTENPDQLTIYDLKPISYPKVKEIDYSLL